MTSSLYGTRPEVMTIGSWEAEDVTVAQVDAALADLRRHERLAAVRASVLTLVAVVSDDAAAEAAIDIVYDLGHRHPSRTVVLVSEAAADARDEEPSGIDAAVSVHAIAHGQRAVSFEDVVLRVRGKARHHLDSVVEPFTLPDLPVVVWLPSRLPSLGDPLLTAADRIVVDTRRVAEEGTAARDRILPRVATLAHRLPVTDLSWIRLAPWRSLLAGLFEGPETRPFLREVERVEVRGNYGPRHLLGGWLLRRLALQPARVHLSPADHVSIRITAVHRDRTGSFCVERTGAHRVIQSSIDIEKGPCVTQTLRMRRQWPALALAGALTRMGRDDVYREALDGAIELAS